MASVTDLAKSLGRSLVLGVYEPAEKDGDFILTPSSQEFNNRTDKKFQNLLQIAGKKLKCGSSRVLYGVDEEFPVVAVANLGKQDAGFDKNELLDQGKENIRTAVAAAVRGLREAGQLQVAVDACGDPQAAGEGVTLCNYSFDCLKAEDKRQPSVDAKVLTAEAKDMADIDASWARGVKMAEGQNFARFLKESPANKMTPTIFCEEAKKNLGSLPNVTVTVHDEDWAKEKGMGSFLSVTAGSAEPARFLEVEYRGGPEGQAPVAFVGKGVTFDSGGISIKPSANMDAMRADMGGAAAVVGSIQAAAALGLPINVRGFVPLCENMPGSAATKPGDVVTAMNGKTIQVDNTDAEGRLILCDALCYAQTFNPRLVLDIATLTGAVVIALGSTASAAYTKSEFIWEQLNKAGMETGDRVWRMPLFKHYTELMTKSTIADINNISASREAGSCTAAAFLQEFVNTEEWVHLDIAGVMSNTSEVPYLCKGMSGRPTRTLTKFLENLSKEN